MSVFSMAGGNPALPTYPLQRSVRLRSSASAYFNRTLTTATDSKIWTWSSWIKIGGIPTYNPIFAAGTTGAAYAALWFNNGTLVLYAYTGATVYHLVTTQVFRDPSAWYHIQVAFNSTEATSTNRVKIYVNGVQVTAFSTATYPSLNYATYFNTAVAHNIGQYTPAGVGYFDGYLTEVNFIDGQALTPSSFGAYNSYGVWSPAKYTGTYGTNGFYLNFQDNSALTTTANVGIGKDSSGNGNYWTSNNISLTAGVTYDSMLDVPTLTSNTNANFAVLNPLSKDTQVVLASGNLNASTSSTSDKVSLGTIYSSSVPFYAEMQPTTTPGRYAPLGFGVAGNTSLSNLVSYYITNFSGDGPYKINNGTSTPIFVGGAAPYAYAANTSDIFQVACDPTTGKVWLGKNNSWFDSSGGVTGNPSTGANPTATFSTLGMELTVRTATSAYSATDGSTASCAVNFGQRPFTYTPPTGFNRLNTYNLPDSIVPVGAQYMAATTWTGTGVAQNITNTVNGFSMQPDLVWVKARSFAYSHRLANSITGATNYLDTAQTVAQFTDAGNSISSFNSNGFGVGTYVSANNNTTTYVGWQWRASNASAVTNTSGTGTSTVSANQTAGFSIVTMTNIPVTAGTNTYGHGLGAAPKLLIFKNINISDDWYVYHASLGNAAYVRLDLSAAQVTAAAIWGNTSPTSSVFTLRNNALNTTTGQTILTYCFAEVPGYSKISSYTANGSADGPFVYLGFRPRFIMVKDASSASGNWNILDTSRSPYNLSTARLMPNQSAAEDTGLSVDVLSNGFKVRIASSDWGVANGNTVVYAAFSENPFKNALAR